MTRKRGVRSHTRDGPRCAPIGTSGTRSLTALAALTTALACGLSRMPPETRRLCEEVEPYRLGATRANASSLVSKPRMSTIRPRAQVSSCQRSPSIAAPLCDGVETVKCTKILSPCACTSSTRARRPAARPRPYQASTSSRDWHDGQGSSGAPQRTCGSSSSPNCETSADSSATRTRRASAFAPPSSSLTPTACLTARSCVARTGGGRTPRR